MFLAHSIRLREPWQCEPTAAGALRYSRVFHKPTGLEPDDDLWLVISGLPDDAKVSVNGHDFSLQHSAFSLQPSQPLPARYNLTPILADANNIEILLPPCEPASAGGPSIASPPFDARLAVMARS